MQLIFNLTKQLSKFYFYWIYDGSLLQGSTDQIHQKLATTSYTTIIYVNGFEFMMQQMHQVINRQSLFTVHHFGSTPRKCLPLPGIIDT
ncbi:hypothetical protein VEJY3_07260 [Vibrio sp. EJY3]|nr:hypothetical protein VEJY3_07260 [Vibrio sp. EJY3]